MFRTLAFCLVMIPVLTAVGAGCGSDRDEAYVAEIDAWHAERLQNLKQETGWLTLVGLHPLGQGRNNLGAAQDNDAVLAAPVPDRLGRVTVLGAAASFLPAAGVEVHTWRDGQPSAKPFAGGSIATDAEGQPDILVWHSVIFYVIQRGEKFFLRVKDMESPTLRDFTGIDRYPVKKSWRVAGRLVGEPGTVRIANVLGQVAPEPSPGILEFELGGRKCRLQPTGKPGESLFVVFGDESNGHGSYPGGRFLVVEAPDSDGRVTLDFNRAYNPPCVFTPFATCPLPGLENMLPMAVTAGEKMWGSGH